MAGKFVTFLQKVGQDFKKGLSVILPIAEAAVPVIAVGNPALAGILQTSIATVIGVEQKFAAMGQQTGTGTQKSAEALTILYPAFEQIFAQYGVQIDKGNVEAYIDAIVAALNAFPALPQPTDKPAPAVTSQQSTATILDNVTVPVQASSVPPPPRPNAAPVADADTTNQAAG